jgi:hypothetical protein
MASVPRRFRSKTEQYLSQFATEVRVSSMTAQERPKERTR